MNDINLTLGTIIRINKFTLTQEAAKIKIPKTAPQMTGSDMPEPDINPPANYAAAIGCIEQLK